MSTLFADVKNLYVFFYENELFSDIKIREFFEGSDHCDIRFSVIKNIYKLIFNNKDIPMYVKYWVKDKDTTVDYVAELYNIDNGKIQSEINNCNRELEEELSVTINNEKVNIVFAVIYKDNLSDIIWDNVVSNVGDAIVKRKGSILDNEPLFKENKLQINIGDTKLNNNIDNDKWSEFIKIIKPYFSSEMNKVIKKITNDYENEYGYLKYLMSHNSGFTDLDKIRCKQLTDLLNSSDNLEETPQSISDNRKKLLEDIEKGKYSQIKTTRRQYNF